MAATFPCDTSTPLPSQSSITSLHREIQVSSTVPAQVLAQSSIPSLHSEIQVSSTVPAQVLSVDTTTNLASSSFLHSSGDVLSSELPSSMSVLVPSGPSGSGSGNNGKIGLVSGIVVFLVIVMASALGIVLAIVFLLRRRKTTRKDPKGLDLSNPNYEACEFLEWYW